MLSRTWHPIFCAESEPLKHTHPMLFPEVKHNCYTLHHIFVRWIPRIFPTAISTVASCSGSGALVWTGKSLYRRERETLGVYPNQPGKDRKLALWDGFWCKTALLTANSSTIARTDWVDLMFAPFRGWILLYTLMVAVQQRRQERKPVGVFLCPINTTHDTLGPKSRSRLPHRTSDGYIAPFHHCQVGSFSPVGEETCKAAQSFKAIGLLA